MKRERAELAIPGAKRKTPYYCILCKKECPEICPGWQFVSEQFPSGKRVHYELCEKCCREDDPSEAQLADAREVE